VRSGFAVAAAGALALGASGSRSLAQDAAPGDVLDALDRASRAVVERCSPAVVRVEAVRRISLRPDAANEQERLLMEDVLRRNPAQETVSSSGFLMDESGLVLTTSAVTGRALSFRVIFPGGQERAGEFLGDDPLAGVALLQVGAVEGVKALRFSGREATPGTLTLFLAPQESEGPALHLGFVTAARRAFGLYDAWLVSSVPLEAGHAGAPLLDARGEVLGMAVAPRISVTFRSMRPAAEGALVTPAGEGTNLQRLLEQSRTMESEPGFSTFVPAGELKRIAGDLRALGRVRRGLLGVKMKVGEPVVREVIEGLPAAKAGFGNGDRILALDGSPVHSAEQVTGYIQRRAPGTSVTIRLRAVGAAERDATVTLGELPVRKALFNGLGVAGRDSYDLTAAKFQTEAVEAGGYVVVESVLEGSAAERAGILPGDWIVEIRGKPILSEKNFADAATGVAASEDSVEITVYRAGEADRRRVVLK